MLKVSCNVTSQIRVVELRRSQGSSPGPISFHRNSATVSVSPVRIGGKTLVQAVVSDKLCRVTRGDFGSESLADRLRLGSLTEDGLSYKEKFIVRSYEVWINKTVTMETIANLLQEVACNHAQSLGFSRDGFATTSIMRKLHLIWVTARMHIEVYKYPAWSDVIEIETWFQGEGKIGTRRDWILKDCATGQVIGRATRKLHIMDQANNNFGLASLDKESGEVANQIAPQNKWVMMNQHTRRLQKVSDEVCGEHLAFCPRELRLAFSEENNNSLRKIPKWEEPAQHSRLGLMPRRADLDMNQHVNNVTYIGWVLESMPQDIIDTHELQTITLDYKRECQQDDIVDSLTSAEPMENNGAILNFPGTNASAPTRQEKQNNLQFLHLLRLSGNGFEISQGQTEWRSKPAR